MRRTSTRRHGLPFLMVALPATGAAAAEGDANGDAKGDHWGLMGRHGGCAELAEAAKRQPACAGVTTPREFAAKARRGSPGSTWAAPRG